ncbi:helix-turn-helix domain-containing protein [Nocardia sp. NBC_00416]|uniref:helix-turn-helix domain-containing protein n=1 Tax=Nocardia sp. NBC_00416 TaxID=2975991 RepID=UPI003FA5514B
MAASWSSSTSSTAHPTHLAIASTSCLILARRTIQFAQAARRAGISVSLLSKIEIGDRTLSQGVAASLAQAMGTTLDEVLGSATIKRADEAVLGDLRSAIRRFDLPDGAAVERHSQPFRCGCLRRMCYPPALVLHIRCARTVQVLVRVAEGLRSQISSEQPFRPQHEIDGIIARYRAAHPESRDAH